MLPRIFGLVRILRETLSALGYVPFLEAAVGLSVPWDVNVLPEKLLWGVCALVKNSGLGAEC